uniref:Uncharacterized protein n=1 Tax=Leersia perrieri TaxID=77586 RepID=A0A0D9WI11_9ORYZ
MAALRLAARRVVAAGLGRPQSTGLVSRAVEERLLPRLIHGSAPPSPVPSCYSFGRLNFSTTSAGKPPKSVHETPGSSEQPVDDLQDRIAEIEKKKEELLYMLAQLDYDFPMALSKYARNSRKLLYLIGRQLRYVDARHSEWAIEERRRDINDRLKYGLPISVAFIAVGLFKFFS